MTAKRATTGWPVEMPPRMPPAWLERKSGLPSLPMRISSAFSSPESAAAAKPSPISTPLTALMRHQRGGEVGIELAVDRRAEPGRHAFGHDLDHRADGRAGLAHAVEIVARRTAPPSASGQKNGLRRDLVPVPVARGRSCAGPSAPARRARRTPGHDLARDRAGRDARRRLARRGAAAAAIIAHAVFHVIGVVGMARPVLVSRSRNSPSSAGRHSRSAARSACRW